MSPIDQCARISSIAGRRSFRLFSTSCSRQVEEPAQALLNIFQQAPTSIPHRRQNPRSRLTSLPAFQSSPTTKSKANTPSRAPPSSGPPKPLSVDKLVNTEVISQYVERFSSKQEAIEGSERAATRKDLEMQQHRQWMKGDVYSPHDLGAKEAKKWKVLNRVPQKDAFRDLGLDPVKQYKNFSIMSEYLTELGRIKHRNQTGLKPVTQRKIAKAIRRAIGVGLMPSVHKHPMLLDPKKYGE